MIEIDGSYKEGGGQILRTASSLSAVTGEPIHVFNIRKGRKNKGLATQHLKGLRGVAALTQGTLEGDSLGSTEIKLHPKKLSSQKLKINLKTAASITLILQSLFLPSAFCEEPVEIRFEGGGTDTFFSPTLDHFRFVFLKIIEKMGPRAELKIERRGFYPEGGAKVKIKIFPKKLKKISLVKRGDLRKIRVVSGATSDLEEKKVAQRQISGARQVLGKLNLPLKEETQYYQAGSTGTQINIFAQLENTVFGRDNLGKLGKSAEEVGKEAAFSFLREVRSNACLDKFTGDQVLPYLALSNKKCRVTVSRVTDHALTNMWVIEKFLEGKFNLKENLITWQP